MIHHLALKQRKKNLNEHKLNHNICSRVFVLYPNVGVVLDSAQS